MSSTTISGHPLIRRLTELVDELDLDRRDLVIFGSGPLLAHGVRRQIRDLDVVARGRAWEQAWQHGLPTVGELNHAPMVSFCGGSIQFSSGWISDDWDVDELIDRAEVIAGLRFARLDEVIRYKTMLDRPKDHADLEAIAELVCGHKDLHGLLCPQAGAAMN